MTLLLFANLLIAGLAAGGFVFMNSVVARALCTLGGPSYVESHQALVPTASPYMVVLTVLSTATTVAVTLVLAFESVPGGAAAAAAGTLLAIGVIAISVGVNVPINKLVCEWAPDAPPANWAAVRARWTRFHAIRTNMSLVAFACSLAAAAIGG